MKYRAEIDGLRAVAIVPVVLFHAGFKAFSGGFVGVDVFFVISGYLITSIILSEKQEGRFTLSNFYQRRIRRIAPALFLVITCSYPLAGLVLAPGAMKEFAQSVVASTFLYSNFYFWTHSGYFAAPAELQPLLHTWSLAVEEQFYLLFPGFLILTWRLGIRVQVAIVALAAVASLTLAQWLLPLQSATAFFLLPTRLWELMLGALAAFRLNSLGQTMRSPKGMLALLPAAGLLMIAVAVSAYDGNTPFPGSAALLPAVGALLIILFGHEENEVGRVLAHPAMVFIGLISYSFYLWHFPLLSFARHLSLGDNRVVMSGVSVLSLGLAYLSWKFVEQPIRTARGVMPLKVFGLATVAACGLYGLGFAGTATHGYRNFYIAYRLDDATKKNYEKYRSATDDNIVSSDDGDCVFSRNILDEAFERRFDGCVRKFGKAVILIGDSHAINVYSALFKQRIAPFFVSLAVGGCRPFQNRPQCPYQRFREFAARNSSQIGAIILQVSGSHFIRDYLGRDDNAAAFVEGTSRSIALDFIDGTFEYLRELPQDIRIIWLGPYVEARVDLGDPHNFRPDRLQFNPVALAVFEELDQQLKEIAAKQRNLSYISLVDALKFHRDSLVHGDCLTFRNQDHFSSCGASLFGPTIGRALAASPTWIDATK